MEYIDAVAEGLLEGEISGGPVALYKLVEKARNSNFFDNILQSEEDLSEEEIKIFKEVTRDNWNWKAGTPIDHKDLVSNNETKLANKVEGDWQ